MTKNTPIDLNSFLEAAERGHHEDGEYLQALREIAVDVWPVIEQSPRYRDWRVIERLMAPDRIISFKVNWTRDDGSIALNRGWRVQHSDVLGPYKGGLRFHGDVHESELKFLALEQTFKNALTPLTLGGAKGGADFDPPGCSEQEIMRFCQAFMTRLAPHIGARTDIPAGDINVGTREIGYLFGQYRRMSNAFEGALTGKGTGWGGSPVREAATGHGLVHFAALAARAVGKEMEGHSVIVSGSGNVASHAAECLIAQGAKVKTLSGRAGTLIWKDGADHAAILSLREARAAGERDLSRLAGKVGASWHDGLSAFEVDGDIAMPCATQNELDEADARRLAETGCWMVAEGSNMASTAQAQKFLREAEGLVYAPSKAANAGGVAVSGFEMARNARFSALNPSALDDELRNVMSHIFEQCCEAAPREGDYAAGANIAAFHRLAEAMIAQGVG